MRTGNSPLCRQPTQCWSFQTIFEGQQFSFPSGRYFGSISWTRSNYTTNVMTYHSLIRRTSSPFGRCLYRWLKNLDTTSRKRILISKQSCTLIDRERATRISLPETLKHGTAQCFWVRQGSRSDAEISRRKKVIYRFSVRLAGKL